MTRRNRDDLKRDRALKLRQQGLTLEQIAERIGSTPRSVREMTRAVRRRRAKATVTL